MTSMMVYSTDGTHVQDFREPEVEEFPVEEQWETPFCFICGRVTDHFAEHDDLVEAGLAEYDGVYVNRTDAWTPAAAKAITDASWERYQRETAELQERFANQSATLRGAEEELSELL